jgi:hypothetical protein
MYPARAAEPEIQEIGGEPLEGSGFEPENSSIAFESHPPSTEEGLNQ